MDEELRPIIRVALEEEIVGDESPDEVVQLVRRLTRREVGIR